MILKKEKDKRWVYKAYHNIEIRFRIALKLKIISTRVNAKSIGKLKCKKRIKTEINWNKKKKN